VILKQQAVEQWKDADLGEMESSCLPRGLEGQRCIQLKGRFGLQVCFYMVWVGTTIDL
jgi:hypothetical protein